MEIIVSTEKYDPNTPAQIYTYAIAERYKFDIQMMVQGKKRLVTIKFVTSLIFLFVYNAMFHI